LRDLGGEVADTYNVRALRDLAAIDNSKARTFLEFGKARMAQRKLAEAESQFVAALQLDPTLFEAWANLAPVLQKLERFDEAIAAYESALRLKPDSVATRFNLGIAHLESGATEAAERVAEEVSATHPDWAQRLRDLIQRR
ncbi:MAG: tetratricopeptide repeat protein, partial [Planctomycetota bacterium]